MGWPQSAAKHKHRWSIIPHSYQNGKSKSKHLGRDTNSFITKGRRGEKQACDVKAVAHKLPAGDHSQLASKQAKFWENLSPQLCYWAQCYMSLNIPLINLGQPPWLGPLSTSYVPPAYSLAAKGINRKSLYAAKLLFRSSQNTDVLSVPFWTQVHITSYEKEKLQNSQTQYKVTTQNEQKSLTHEKISSNCQKSQIMGKTFKCVTYL